MAGIRFRTLACAVLVGTYLLAIFAGGMWVRDWVWRECDAIHFRGDINRARQHGEKIVAAASAASNLPAGSTPSWRAVFTSYLANYDELIADRPDGKYDLDYPPIRLLIMTLWSRLIYNAGPIEDVCTTDLCRPLLNLNTCAELLAAIAAFLLVKHWVAVEQERRRPWIFGLAAATFVWFDPSLLLDAHGWPQWDAWVLPFFLFAAWAGSTNRWLLAGTLIGIGGGFKGQLWTVAPVLLLWPLFGGRWMSLLKILVGCVFGIACIHSIWVLSIPDAREWLVVPSIVSLLLGVNRKFERTRTTFWAVNILAAVAFLWPWILADDAVRIVLPFFLFVVMILTAMKLPRRHAAVAICGLAAALIFLAGDRYSASFGWFKVGILFGARRHQQYMFAGTVNNLPAILQMRFGWSDTAQPCITVPFFGQRYDVTVGQLLIAIYGMALIVCAIGLALNTRRRSRWALLSLMTPWVLLYTLMPQMRERYLLWGGVMSATWIGVGLGPTLLHLLITLLSMETILQVMLESQAQPVWPTLDHVLRQMHPSLGWAVILCAIVCLYLSVARAFSTSLQRPSIAGD